MKVLFLKKHYHPFGGAEIYLQNLAQHLAKEGEEVYLLTSRWEGDPGFKVHSIKIFSFFYSDLAFALKAKNKAKEFRDCVIFSFDRTLFQHIYRASDGCHLRWLENRKKFLEPFYRSLILDYNPKHLVLKWLEKKCLENSKIIVTNSRMVREDFGKFYGTEIYEKCRVIYNGVDLKKFRPVTEEKKLLLRKELSIPEEEPVLLFLGSGYFRKGLVSVLRALSLLREGLLIVVGKEKKLRYFKRFAERLGITGRVRFLGAQKEVVKLYQAADVFVLPTIYDPFSNACLEALACGLPVITTSANGAAEIIKDGKNGFVLDLPVDMEELAYKIEQVLKDLPKMRTLALTTAPKFSIEKAIQSLKDTIKQCAF